jgi:hypothetical protein
MTSIPIGDQAGSVEVVTFAANAMHDLQISNCSLNRRVALGVSAGGLDGKDAWVVFDCSSGILRMHELRYCGPLADTDSELSVEFVAIASPEVWQKIGNGGRAAAVLACDEKDVLVSGKLPFFIRHVRSIIDLFVVFGESLVKGMHSA